MKNPAVAAALLAVSATAQNWQGSWSWSQRGTLNIQGQGGSTNQGWLQWSGWSGCQGECGRKVRIASRKCAGGVAGVGRCQGSEIRKKSCADAIAIQDSGPCPYWSFWSEWSSCMVTKSTNCCLPDQIGSRTRTRTCQDPYATERGEVPQCEGPSIQEDPSLHCHTRSPAPVCPSHCNKYIWEPWGPCSSTCGEGTQVRIGRHQCAGVPGSICPKTIKEEHRQCITPCCILGEWQEIGNPKQCVKWTTHRTRQNIEIAGGCRLSDPPIPLIETIESGTQSPTLLTGQSDCQRGLSEIPWSACQVNTANTPRVQGLATTCNRNGLQTRASWHYCVSIDPACRGNNDCVWKHEPYSCASTMPCGPEMESTTESSCENICAQKKCFTRTGCFNDYRTIIQTETPCLDAQSLQFPCLPEAQDRWEPSCEMVYTTQDVMSYRRTGKPLCISQCGCGNTHYTVIESHPCQPPRKIEHPCPTGDTSLTWSGWQKSQAFLLLAPGQCCCIGEAKFHDYKTSTIIETAANGERCVMGSGESEFQANAQCREQCLGQPQCEACPECYYPDQPNPTARCSQIDQCTGHPVPTTPRSCMNVPPCCVSRTEESVCSGGGPCPSDGPPTYTITTYNTCPHLFPNTTQTIECPHRPCPDYGAWSNWSECSWTIPSAESLNGMCVCGGFRERTRTHPCPEDAASGRCPTASIGWAGNNAASSWNRQIDSYSERHHSQHCYDIGMKCLGAWSQWTVPVLDTAYPCSNEGKKRMISTRRRPQLCLDKDDLNYWIVETRVTLEDPAPCVDQFKNCEYDYEGCPIFEHYHCEAIDQCSSTSARRVPLNQTDSVRCPFKLNEPSPSNPFIPTHIHQEECQKQLGHLGGTWEYISESPCESLTSEDIITMKNKGIFHDDECFGKCKVTCRRKCTGEFKNIPIYNCAMPKRWGEWSEWMMLVDSLDKDPVNPAVHPWEVYQSNQELAINQGVCHPYPCGGIVRKTRVEKCLGFNVDKAQEDIVDIQCPEPVWAPAECTPRSQTCYDRRSAVTHSTKVCTRRTDPKFAHCPCPHGDDCERVVEEKLEPCQKTVVKFDTYCRHPRDSRATCGKGQVHTTVIYETIDIVTGAVVGDPIRETVAAAIKEECKEIWDSTAQNTNYYGYNGWNSRFNDCYKIEECELQFQPRIVSSDGICGQCGGSPAMRTFRYECDGECALDLCEGQLPAPQVISDCPVPVPAYPDPWSTSECLPCVQSVSRERLCSGGNKPFSLNPSTDPACACQQCCLATPGDNVIREFGREVITQQCPPYEPRRIEGRWKDDPNCECGACTKRWCTLNECRPDEPEQCSEPVPNPKPIPQPPHPTWSECIYAPNVDPQRQGWICDDDTAYRFRQIITTCYDGQLVNMVRNETTKEARVDPQCMRTSTIRNRATGCDTMSNRCYPTETIEVVRTCLHLTEVVSTTTKDCCASGPPGPDGCGGRRWSEWSECPLQCGTSQQSRYAIRVCDNQQIPGSEEFRDCGCEQARWSDWSVPTEVCDPCGEAVQYRTQQRYCQRAQHRYYKSDTFYWGGRYPTDSCYNSPCNECPIDASGEGATRRIAFNRDEVCPMGPIPQVEPICSPNPTCHEKVENFPVYDQCGRLIHTRVLKCPPGRGGGITTITTNCTLTGRDGPNLPCGRGLRTITTTGECQTASSRTEECDMGPITSVVSDWSACSKTCGGGTLRRETIQVCQNDMKTRVGVQVKSETEACAMHPCSYWGGWSSWGTCSTTCGTGVVQRVRKCEGGLAGQGLCTGSPTETKSCYMGDCCLFDWSGWSSCCQRNDKQLRLRWRGNECSKKWEELEEPCTDRLDEFGEVLAASYPSCSVITGLQQEYQFGGSVRIEYQPESQYTNIRRGWPSGSDVVNYGRVVTGGSYSVGGFTYRLDGYTWYDANGAIIAVEEFNYDNTWYYKFGETWYKYTNGIFAATSIPYGHPSYISNWSNWRSASNVQSSSIVLREEAQGSSSNFLAPVGNSLTQMSSQSSSSNSGSLTIQGSTGSIVQSQNNMSGARQNPFSFMGFNQ